MLPEKLIFQGIFAALIAAIPVAASTVIIVLQYSDNPAEGAKFAGLSSALSIITLPIETIK
ncbi:MAG: hypothetical protein LBU24_00680 [Methanocalculaceae archaeon]|jgi:predicted permease|nr:hypothetical protein [Methanocalculaceae archaeon]